MAQTDADVRMNLRLPYGTYTAIRETAESERRSLNQQLVVAVEGWLFGNGPDWFRAQLVARNNDWHERTAPAAGAPEATDA